MSKSTFTSLTAGKLVGAPGTWSKRVFQQHLVRITGRLHVILFICLF